MLSNACNRSNINLYVLFVASTQDNQVMSQFNYDCSKKQVGQLSQKGFNGDVLENGTNREME